MCEMTMAAGVIQGAESSKAPVRESRMKGMSGGDKPV
jgi:hypothetical protein